MKILHTSDWHLGQTFYDYDRTEEHKHFFEQLKSVVREEKPDLLLVSGDLFHTSAPSIAAQELYNESCFNCVTKVSLSEGCTLC